jgi:UrcA family protein
MNRCVAAFLALLFASITVSSACFAQTTGEARLLVRYDDLDLSTPAGMKALHRRIDLAANQVCRDPTGPSPAFAVHFICKADAARSARHQIKSTVAQQRLAATERR